MSSEKQTLGALSLEEGLARIRARKPKTVEGIQCGNSMIYTGFADEATPATPKSLLPSLIAYDLAVAELEKREGRPVSADGRTPPAPELATDYFTRFDAAMAAIERSKGGPVSADSVCPPRFPFTMDNPVYRSFQREMLPPGF